MPSSIKIKSNPKDFASALHLLGLEDCKAVATPCIERGRGGEKYDDDENLNHTDQGVYRQVRGILNYFARERLDIQYAVRMLGQHLLGRGQLRENVIRVEWDADWAGAPESRRSRIDDFWHAGGAGAEALFLQSVLTFVGEVCKIALHTDSAAAIGIAQSSGSLGLERWAEGGFVPDHEDQFGAQYG
eukprot:1361594-Amphidinium_carterae.1